MKKVIILLCSLIMILSLSACDIENTTSVDSVSTTKEDPVKNDIKKIESEVSFIDSELYKSALNQVDGEIKEWVYEDFDNDGKKEAFIAVGGDDYESSEAVKSLWYFGDASNQECIIDQEQYWYFVDQPFVFEDCKLLYVDGRHGYETVIGVKNDVTKEVSVPEDSDFYWIAQDSDTKEVTAAGKREGVEHVLNFDYETMSFTDTGKMKCNTLYEYIGKTGNDVIADFGDDFIRETYEGPDGIDYRDIGIWFFLWEDGFDAPVSVISASKDIDIGFGLNAQMTLGALKEACKKLDVSIEDPETSYDEIDDMMTCGLSFEYKDFIFEYSWDAEDNPDKSKSTGVFIKGKKFFNNADNSGGKNKSKDDDSSSYLGYWENPDYSGEDPCDVEVTVNEYTGNSADIEIVLVHVAYSDPIQVRLDKNGTGSFDSHGEDCNIKGTITFKNDEITLKITEASDTRYNDSAYFAGTYHFTKDGWVSFG